MSKDLITGSLKKILTCIVHSHNHRQHKKEKNIHSYFHHISNDSIPNSFVRYTVDFIKFKMVVVDGSTNDQDDIKQPIDELSLPLILLSIRNAEIYLYQPFTMEHHQWDWNTVLMMELQSLIYYHEIWRSIQQSSRVEIDYTTIRYVMHSTVWNFLNARVLKGVISLISSLKTHTSTALLECNQTVLKLLFLHNHIIFPICLIITKTL